MDEIINYEIFSASIIINPDLSLNIIHGSRMSRNYLLSEFTSFI